jgi:hypothetical protein
MRDFHPLLTKSNERHTTRERQEAALAGKRTYPSLEAPATTGFLQKAEGIPLPAPLQDKPSQGDPAEPFRKQSPARQEWRSQRVNPDLVCAPDTVYGWMQASILPCLMPPETLATATRVACWLR